MPFIIRGIKLWGIDSVMVGMERRKFIWSEISKFVDFNILEKGVNEVDLSELLETYPKMLKGEISGRVLVKI